MEEFWHLALYPYLVERLNRSLRSRGIQPSEPNVSKILLLQGELLSKAFALASFDEFRQSKRYDVPEREPKGKERAIVHRIEHVGIREALRAVGKSRGF